MVALSNSPLERMSPQEFLAWEATQEERYEYVNGRIIAMTGGTIPHNDLALNLYRALYDHARSRGCKVNVSDVKVKLRRRFRYPDLVVTCDDRDKAAIKLFQYPKVIVEVLSPGTEAIDSAEPTLCERGEKLQEYQRLATLEEYVLMNSEKALVEVYRRSSERVWLYESYGIEDALVLKSLDFECAIAQVYEGIPLSAVVEVEDPDED
jgi:Uma2 family endonuclease